jgi:hypothetical protein
MPPEETNLDEKGDKQHGRYGGGKLGMYSNWPSGSTWPSTTQTPQYEFYDYTGGNGNETGNDAFSSGSFTTLADAYRSAFNTIRCSELYKITFAGGLQSRVQTAYGAAFQAYMSYLGQTGTTPSSTSCGTSAPHP